MSPTKKTQSKNVPAVKLSALSPSTGSNHRAKIVGRGIGSGHGRHATRGMKGQRSRRGDTKMIGFEGGQSPILRRIPKRGFNPPFPKEYNILNVCDLEFLFKSNETVSLQELLSRGFVKAKLPLKVLGGGDLKKSLKVVAQAFSKQAKEKIVAAGGTAELLER